MKKGASLSSYGHFVEGITELLQEARRQAARSVNALLTAVYWEIGRRIVEYEQAGRERAEYGEALLRRLTEDLSGRFGRGFGLSNLKLMRKFYLNYSEIEKGRTTSGLLPKAAPREKGRTLSGLSASNEMFRNVTALEHLACKFSLPWSHYARLLTLDDAQKRKFYESEACRGGWSVRQLDRQIDSQFYERTALSRNKVAMLKKGQKARPEDAATPEDEIKDPYVLEFLGLKDEYSETDLEEALIRHLESFLLELGGDFAFIARQKRLRIGSEWYRVDLVFFHRRLRCLVLIDLKLGRFTHADAGQMHLYLNFARDHWTHPAENPPVGLILCTCKDAAVVHYALDGLPNKVMAAEYQMVLPNEHAIAQELEKTRRTLESRQAPAKKRGKYPKSRRK